MTTPETTARAGDGVSAPLAAAELKSALSGLMTDLAEFRGGIAKQLKAQEEKLNMLDRKTALAARPALSVAAETDLPHRKALGAYIRSGNEEQLRGVELEQKALNTADGVLVDPHTSEMVRSSLAATASLRAIASIVQVESNSFDVLVDHGTMRTGWSRETEAFAETETPIIHRISIPLNELSAMPKASQRLLDDAAFDIEGWLADRIAKSFARAESWAFINGNGSDKPTGLLHRTPVPNDNWNWGQLGYVATGAAGDFATVNPSDSIIELVYALEAPYRANATFVMSSKTAGAVRKMKDADGRFLWADGLASGEPARLMGYPVLVCEQMPEIGDNRYAIAFGDFQAGYTVAERPDLRILRDPFSAKPHVLFYATKRVGGDVSDFAAIKLLKFAAS